MRFDRSDYYSEIWYVYEAVDLHQEVSEKYSYMILEVFTLNSLECISIGYELVFHLVFMCMMLICSISLVLCVSQK